MSVRRWWCALLIVSACSLEPASLPGLPSAITLIPSPPAATRPAETPSLAPTETPLPSRTPAPTQTSTASPTPGVVSLMAVGDVMLARGLGERITTEGIAPYRELGALLGGADVAVANLECAISERGAPQPKAYVFRAPPIAAEALRVMGVDVVSLANNHALDYGPEALLDTIGLLRARGIEPVGAGGNASESRTPVVVERNGLRLAFLAYVDVPVESRSGFDTRAWSATESTPGLAWADPAAISADATAARQSVDVVIVLLHSGYENRPEPNDIQRRAARAAIDAGAALVVGAHPHVLQATETYNGGLIAYSLGNFIFDEFDGAANDTAILAVQLGRGGVLGFEWLPMVIENGSPRAATPDESERILRRVQPITPTP